MNLQMFKRYLIIVSYLLTRASISFSFVINQPASNFHNGSRKSSIDTRHFQRNDFGIHAAVSCDRNRLQSRLRPHEISKTTTTLYTFPCSSSIMDSTLALSTISLSTGIAYMSRLKFLGGMAGAETIIALVVAAFISNFGLFGFTVPLSHPIYDMCWSRFLPASLALVLLSISSKDGTSDDTSWGGNVRVQQREAISAVCVPFIIGSIGSIIGCAFSALFLMRCDDITLGTNALSLIGMTPYEAVIAAGCLCASYIGGSVNFFATANIITRDMHSLLPASYNGSTKQVNDLFSAMAAADLVVMAVYFGGLSALLSWNKLRRLFPGRLKECDNGAIVDEKQFRSKTQSICNKKKGKMTIAFGLTASILVLSIVELSLVFERYTCRLIPGMGCAAVAVLGTAVRSLLDRLVSVKPKGESVLKNLCRMVSNFDRDLKDFGPGLSDFCFLLLFGSIGTSANVRTALAHGLPCFVFAFFALCIHFLILGLGSVGAMKIFPSLRRLSLEDLLVASNAAIGGASTAATFAGTMSEKRISIDYKRGLILAATLWGVVGYAFATTVGVLLTKTLIHYYM